MAQILIWTLITAALIAAFVTRAAEKTRKAEHYFKHARHGEQVTNTGDAGIDEIFQPVNRCENSRTTPIASAVKRTAAA